MVIIDSHCHIHDPRLQDILDDVLIRAREANITHLVTIGCDIATTTAARAIASIKDNVFFSAGFHPHDAKDMTDDAFATLETLARDPKCVAIGECGLDYYYQHSSVDEQKRAFIKQMTLAQDLNKPLIIHLRDAFDDCVSLLKLHWNKGQKCVIHCFSGTLPEAQVFHDLGCHISISGIITFKKPGALPEVVKTLPLDSLMVETDCPYLTPHPFRGKTNEPSFIRYTLNAIAAYRSESPDVVEHALYNTTKNFFAINTKG